MLFDEMAYYESYENLEWQSNSSRSEYIKRRSDEKSKKKIELENLTDAELFLLYEKESRNSHLLNDGFPAYDIALKLKTNSWSATKKQRNALELVLVNYYTRNFTYVVSD